MLVGNEVDRDKLVSLTSDKDKKNFVETDKDEDPDSVGKKVMDRVVEGKLKIWNIRGEFYLLVNVLDCTIAIMIMTDYYTHPLITKISSYYSVIENCLGERILIPYPSLVI